VCSGMRACCQVCVRVVRRARCMCQGCVSIDRCLYDRCVYGSVCVWQCVCVAVCVAGECQVRVDTRCVEVRVR
jgi:hypothetical protein